MTSTISRYLSGKGGGNKRNHSSTSSSDACQSPDSEYKGRVRTEPKKQKQDKEDSADSSVGPSADVNMEDSLREIKETLSTLATKEDVKALRDDMEKITAALTVNIEKLESKVFDLEAEKDLLNTEINKLKGENQQLKGQLEQQKKEANNLKLEQNDHEQHSRQWNLRVYGVPEARGEETVDDCVKKCAEVFSKKVGAPVTTADLEIAHRTGKKGATDRPRPILVRFFSRRMRGLVLTDRRKLKQSGVSIGEDLTQANFRLLKKVGTHSATMSSWSGNGKILAKLKNGKILRVDINTDIDALFTREM